MKMCVIYHGDTGFKCNLDHIVTSLIILCYVGTYNILSEIYCTRIEFRCGKIIILFSIKDIEYNKQRVCERKREREREKILCNEVNINISCISHRGNTVATLSSQPTLDEIQKANRVMQGNILHIIIINTTVISLRIEIKSRHKL